jgi:S1-C subfamily serine protease
VSIGSGDGRLTVQRVGENSRAARLGLESGDVIRKVDGKDVATVGELRTLVAAKEKGLVVEVTRDGEDLKLTEKEGKKGE